MKRFLALFIALLLAAAPVEAGYKALLGVGKPPGGGGGGSFTITPGGQTTGPNTSTTNSFTGLSLAGVSASSRRRAVVIASVYATNISSATINGSAATAVRILNSGTGTNSIAIFQGDVSSGTTFDFVATTTAAAAAGMNVTWAIIETSTPAASANYGTDGSSSTIVTLTGVTIPSGGGGLAGVMTLGGGGPFTWTNATNIETAAVAAGYTLQMATVTATGTVDSSLSGGGPGLSVAATWAP